MRISVAYGNIPAPGLRKKMLAQVGVPSVIFGCLAESTAMFEQSAPRIDAVIIKAGFGNLTEWQVKLEGGLISETFHPKYISRVLPSVFNYAVALLVGLR